VLVETRAAFQMSRVLARLAADPYRVMRPDLALGA